MAEESDVVQCVHGKLRGRVYCEGISPPARHS